MSSYVNLRQLVLLMKTSSRIIHDDNKRNMVRDAISHIEKIESRLSLSYEPTSDNIYISTNSKKEIILCAAQYNRSKCLPFEIFDICVRQLDLTCSRVLQCKEIESSKLLTFVVENNEGDIPKIVPSLVKSTPLIAQLFQSGCVKSNAEINLEPSMWESHMQSINEWNNVNMEKIKRLLA